MTAENTTTSVTLGGRIQAAREAAGLSPSQLAMRTNVQTNTTRNWESDRSEPRANQLTMLAGILGVPVLWLLTGEGFDESVIEDTMDETRGIAGRLDRLLVAHQKCSVLIMELLQEVNCLQNKIDIGGMEVAEASSQK